MSDSKGESYVAASQRPLGSRRRHVDLGSDGPATLVAWKKSANSAEDALFAIGMGGDGKPHLTAPYEESPHVHACVKVKGAAVRSVPGEFWIGDPRRDKDAQLLPAGDPLWKLLERPCPNMTSSEFFEAGLHHRAFDGEDFWFLLDEAGKPLEFKPTAPIPMPAHIMPVRGSAVSLLERNSATGWPLRWSASTHGGGSLNANAAAVIHFRDYNIHDPLRGIGDLESIAAELDIDWQATRYQRALLKNGGDPGGFIVGPEPLAPDEREAAENEANEAFDVKNAGRWKYIGGDHKYVPNKIGPKEMQFPLMRNWTREVVCQVFGVPPPLIGVLKDAALANIETSVRLFWEGGNGVLAYLRSLEDVITTLFLRSLAHKDGKKLFFRFNLSGVSALQKNLVERLKVAAEVAAGLNLSPYEALKLAQVDVEKGSLKFGDRHIVAQSNTTLDSVVDEADNPQPSNDGNGGDGGGSSSTPAATDGGDENSDGKAAPIVAREADPATDPAEPAPDPEKLAEQERRAYWKKKASAILIPGQADLKSCYRRFRKPWQRDQLKRIRDFAEQGDAALRSVRAQRDTDPSDPSDPADDIRRPSDPDADRLILPHQRTVERLDSSMRPGIIRVFARALEDSGIELADEFPMEPSSPAVIEAINLRVNKLTGHHVEVLESRVRDALSDALSKATNTGTLQERVLEVLTDIESNLNTAFKDLNTRANVIARTETAGAANDARMIEMKKVGIQQHTWVTSNDSAVRGAPGGHYPDSSFSHFELDNRTVELGQLFNAEKHPGLTYPHDPNGQAGDVIQCRCLTRPVRPPDEEATPS